VQNKPVNMPTVHLLDYVAGNIRSLVNAIEKVGYTVEWIRSPQDVANADVRNYILGDLIASVSL
jgi:imidazoleglycerol phosphate synthase glutamine amidotransferase subunit HisH